MKVDLYTTKLPTGRSILLVQKLGHTTNLPSQEICDLMYRLFLGKHGESNRATVEVPNEGAAAELATVCAEVGVIAFVQP